MEYLFCDQIISLKVLQFPEIFKSDYYDLKNFDNDCLVVKNTIKNLYESNDEDIEDFTDLIIIINNACFSIMRNKIFNYEQIIKFSKLRIYAKKMVKKKYRDYKYNNRIFFNNDLAHQQYFELVEYIWKPSVQKYIELALNYTKLT